MSPGPTRVRQATADDAADLAPLVGSLGYPADPATLRDRLDRLEADDPTGRVLVAVRNRSMVGFVTLHLTPTLHRPTPVGRITALAVLPGHQRGGVGRLLVEAAEQFFRESGIARVEVTSGPSHVAAYDFYRRLGYVDQGARFARPL